MLVVPPKSRVRIIRYGSLLAGLSIAACQNEVTSNDRVPAALSIVDGNGQSATVGTELPDALVARVVDAQQLPISGQLVNFRVVSGGGSVFAGSAISNADGIVRERWTLGTSTSVEQRVQARAVDNETGEPLVFADFTAIATAGPAASIDISDGDGQSGSALSTLPESLEVLVRDQYSNPASGASVSWTAQANAGSLSPNPSTADASGLARAAWTLGTRGGPVTATASIGVATATFTGTATGGTAAQIEPWSGDGQIGVVGETLSVRLTARVIDAFGNPVGAGVPVEWIKEDSTALLAAADATTDPSGYARATWILGLPIGVQRLRAIAANDTATFSATGRAFRVDFYDGCALVAGAGYCWGDNDFGEVGDGTYEKRPFPTPVKGGLTFRDISKANRTGCGVTLDDVAHCWGRYHGRTTPPFAEPGPVMAGVRDIVVGAMHVCLLALDGHPWCWGFNHDGEVGDSTQVDKGIPTSVRNTTAVFTQLALGTGLSCGLTAQGEVFCWGANDGGVLGTYGIGGQRSTTPINAAPGWNFSAIAVGHHFVCGLTSAGKVYCWGDNERGTLGDGTTTRRITPGLVAGDLTFEKLFAHHTTACGLTTDSVLYCWGWNVWGELGDLTTQQRNVPTRFRGGINPISVVPGVVTCGIANGYLYCWGMRNNAPHPRPWGVPPP